MGHHSALKRLILLAIVLDGISMVQANLQRKRLATQELLHEAVSRKADVSLVQEPYVGADGFVKHYNGTRIVQRTQGRSKPVKAAIIVHNEKVEIYEDPTLTTENIAYVAIKTKNRILHLVSVYFEVDEPLEPYLEHVKTIVEKVNTRNLILGGDVNAWSTWWGSSKENRRGADLASFLNELELHILNIGDEPTFETVRDGKLFTSRVDITTCSVDMLDKVDDWKVDRCYTSSDHNAIIFNIKLKKYLQININRSTRKFNTKKAKWPLFIDEFKLQLHKNTITEDTIEQIDTTEKLEHLIGEYIKCIKIACDKAIPQPKINNKFNLPWWSNELESLKCDMTTKKRRIRNAAQSRRRYVVEEYIAAKGKYEEKAKIAQTESWKTFCSKQDRESMWDSIYRVIKLTGRRSDDKPMMKDGQTLNPTDSVKLLTETFFPDDKLLDDTPEHSLIRLMTNRTTSSDDEDPCFTLNELQLAINGFSPRKAPGPDGFTADICLAAINYDPKLFLNISNKCLKLAHFPEPWKMATVIVLRKPGKTDYNHPKSYRPIGLLSILGKTLEKMMVSRLKWHIIPKLNPRQYGFVPQRSTEDALYDLTYEIKERIKRKEIIILISLDIEGAFDSAWWPAIKLQLMKKKCPRNLFNLVHSYLENRNVQVTYAGETFLKKTTKGCVQGSIGGPIFWNLLLDPLLDIMDNEGVYSQAFADDVVLVFSGQNTQDIQRKANMTLDIINNWGILNKLKFAAHKTNAMVITRKRNYDTPRLNMGGKDIAL